MSLPPASSAEAIALGDPRPLPLLGFGASTLGSVFGEVTMEEAYETVRSALDRNLCFFDTSPFYGDTRSESVLGECLARYRRESTASYAEKNVLIGTKCGRFGDRPTGEWFDFRPETCSESVEKSLRRLQWEGQGPLAYVLCHDIEFAPPPDGLDAVWNPGGAIDRLLLMRDHDRTIERVGVSAYPLPILQEAFSRRSEIDVVIAYCHLSLCNDSLLAWVSELRRQLYAGKRTPQIISASPLHMGLLVSGADATHPPVWHPAPEKLRLACTDAAKIIDALTPSTETNQAPYTLATFALRYSFVLQLINNDIICSTLVGIRNPLEIDVAIDALEAAKRIVERHVPPALLSQLQSNRDQLVDPIVHDTTIADLFSRDPLWWSTDADPNDPRYSLERHVADQIMQALGDVRNSSESTWPSGLSENQCL